MERLYKNGALYDKIFKQSKEDSSLDFWLSQAGDSDSKVLELCCGTGRVTHFLAQQGLKVSGIDLYDGMLEVARRKALADQLNVNYMSGDISQCEYPQDQDLIFITGNSICHLLNPADAVLMFQKAYSALASNGRFIVDVFIPSIDHLTVNPEEEFLISNYDSPVSAESLQLYEKSSYDSVSQIKSNTYIHKNLSGQEIGTENFPLKMYFPQEIISLFLSNGFSLDGVYSSYFKSELSSDSKQMIAIGRAPIKSG